MAASSWLSVPFGHTARTIRSTGSTRPHGQQTEAGPTACADRHRQDRLGHDLQAGRSLPPPAPKRPGTDRLGDTPSDTDRRDGRPQNATARTERPLMPGRAIITGETGNPHHETNE